MYCPPFAAGVDACIRPCILYAYYSKSNVKIQSPKPPAWEGSRLASMVLFFYNKQYKNEIFAGYSHLYDPLTGRWPFLAGPEHSYGACVDLLVEEFLPNTTAGT